MDNSFEWQGEDVISRLQEARNKLTPIVDDIIFSTAELILRGDDRFINKQTLTLQQCQDVVWTTQMLKDVEFKMDNKGYHLPNSNVIVNNMLVDNKSKSVVIDEETVVELLQVYEQMGLIIQRLMKEQVPLRIKSAEKTVSKTSKHVITPPHSTTVIHGEAHDIVVTDIPKSSKHVITPPYSTTVIHADSRDIDVTEESDDDKLERKSTLSALLNSSSGNVSRKPDVVAAPKIEKSEPTVFLRIQCCSDISDQEHAGNAIISCAKNCTSQFHIELDGKPVTLKMNQATIKDGTVYCINTGQNGVGDDIRIIIKQCPECMSTVVGSSTKINDVLGESHESITLHGKHGDETKMTYSSSEDGSCKCEDCMYLEKCKPCRCKMDVTLDVESVDRSTVKVHTPSSTSLKVTSPERGRTPEASLVEVPEKSKSIIAKREPVAPLTRRKICSSMEFDVTKAPTRLREHEIEHGSAHIVIELKKLGVDEILRACRPAKCCRKAILNERQRTALPYCVSLKSLPLMAQDVAVIKQSIDMSVKKKKNSLDLTQAAKDKMAFYVSLGKDDFRMNSNPWVIPVYDLKLGPGLPTIQNRFFFLKNAVGLPRQLQSLARLMKAISSDENEEKFFVLKKLITVQVPTSEESDAIEVCKKKVRSSTKKIKFKQHQGGSSSRTIYKRKNVWSSISHEDWKLVFSQEEQHLSLNRSSTKPLSLKKSIACGVSYRDLIPHVDTSSSVAHRPVTKTTSLKTIQPSGDHIASLKKIFDAYKRNMNEKKLTKKKPRIIIYIDSLLPRSKSMPVLKLKALRSPKPVRSRSFENISKSKRISKPEPEAKKLEYYVGLVNGDLIWSQNYDTYYNYYNNDNSPPVEDPMYVTRVTPEESSRGRPTPTAGPQTEDRRSTISEIPEEDLVQLRRSAPLHQPVKYAAPTPILQSFSEFPMGPEDQEAPWAPLTASETSLPRPVEEVVQKEEVNLVEATPASEEKIVPPAKPVKPAKDICAEKTICKKNKCVDCKKKHCNKKKCNAKDIVISIKKVKNKGICVEAVAPKPCNKEICELYKNENLAGTSKAKPIECEKYKIMGKDDIEIYINNDKVCVKNKNKNKSKSTEKEIIKEKKQN